MSLYQNFVKETAMLYLQMVSAESGKNPVVRDQELTPLENPLGAGAKLKILMIAPHPDDECLMGSYALRLKESFQAQVWVLPYSFGSKRERQEARKQELVHAVAKLGFELLPSIPAEVNALKSLVEKLQINMIFTPHEEDGHPVHQKVFYWVKELLAAPQAIEAEPLRKIAWVQSEFWRDMVSPNLLIPLSIEQVSQIGEALQCHQGEVARNPYHLRLPAWFQDQVRKGSERVGERGQVAENLVFGQLYQISFSNCK